MVHFWQFTVTDQIICHCCYYDWISSDLEGSELLETQGTFCCKFFICLWVLSVYFFCIRDVVGAAESATQWRLLSASCSSPGWSAERLNAAAACFASGSAPLILGSKFRHSSCPVGVLLKHRDRCLQHQDRKYREIKLQQGGWKTLNIKGFWRRNSIMWGILEVENFQESDWGEQKNLW